MNIYFCKAVQSGKNKTQKYINTTAFCNIIQEMFFFGKTKQNTKEMLKSKQIHNTHRFFSHEIRTFPASFEFLCASST